MTPQELIVSLIGPGKKQKAGRHLMFRENFDSAYNATNRITASNCTATMTDTGGGVWRLRVVGSQAPVTTNLSNGATTTTLGRVQIHPNVKGPTMKMRYQMIMKATVAFAPTVDRHYLGQGITGTGEKDPKSGGALVSVSSDLVDNRTFVDIFENAGTTLDTLIVQGDELIMKYTFFDHCYWVEVWRGSILLKTFAYTNSIANDMEGRIGQFSMFFSAGTFDIHYWEAWDLGPKTCNILLHGDSILFGWGVHSTNAGMNLARLLENDSQQVVMLLADSSATPLDGQGSQSEIEKAQPDIIISNLGANAYLDNSPVNKTNATIITEITGLINMYKSITSHPQIIWINTPPILNENVVEVNNAISALPDVDVLDAYSLITGGQGSRLPEHRIPSEAPNYIHLPVFTHLALYDQLIIQHPHIL